MGRVDVTVNGRTYPIACGDGEEQRVADLARYVDSRLRDMAKGVASGNEAQMLVLAALVLADELDDVSKRAEASRKEAEAWRAAAATRVATLAARVDTIARRLQDV